MTNDSDTAENREAYMVIQLCKQAGDSIIQAEKIMNKETSTFDAENGYIQRVRNLLCLFIPRDIEDIIDNLERFIRENQDVRS